MEFFITVWNWQTISLVLLQFDVVHHMLNGKSHLGSLMVELLCCCYCSSQRSYSNMTNAVKVMESRSAVKIFTTSRRATPIGLTGLQPPPVVCVSLGWDSFAGWRPSNCSCTEYFTGLLKTIYLLMRLLLCFHPFLEPLSLWLEELAPPEIFFSPPPEIWL